MDTNQDVNLDACRPLGAALFFYECIRLFLLVFFLLVVSMEAPLSGIYSVYSSSNALFPLMALFIWLRPQEYKNFTTLYIAGKVIILISFYAWEFFSLHRGIQPELVLGPGIGYREFLGAGNLARGIILFGGGAFLSLADILSVWGAWIFNKKYNRALAPECGGS